METVPGPTLTAFGTDRELRRYLDELAEAARVSFAPRRIVARR